MHKITILPQNKDIYVEDGANLRTSIISDGNEVKSPCGGCASCGQCIVVIKDGADSLSAISFEEKQILGNTFHITKERLSCQTLVKGNVTVDVTVHVPAAIPPKTNRRTREEAVAIVADRKEISAGRPQKQGGWNKPKTFTSGEEE